MRSLILPFCVGGSQPRPSLLLFFSLLVRSKEKPTMLTGVTCRNTNSDISVLQPDRQAELSHVLNLHRYSSVTRFCANSPYFLVENALSDYPASAQSVLHIRYSALIFNFLILLDQSTKCREEKIPPSPSQDEELHLQCC